MISASDQKNTLNIITLKPGDVIRMSDGALYEVRENPGDGLWVFGVQLDADGVAGESENPLFAQDIVDCVADADLAGGDSSSEPE
jgi:hypothetical protein